jgi:hypothetical protein
MTALGRACVRDGTNTGHSARAGVENNEKGPLTWGFRWCPREESNLRTRFRKPHEHTDGMRLRYVSAGSGSGTALVDL